MDPNPPGTYYGALVPYIVGTWKGWGDRRGSRVYGIRRLLRPGGGREASAVGARGAKKHRALGFGVEGYGCRVSNLGFRFQGFEFSIQGFEFRQGLSTRHCLW